METCPRYPVSLGLLEFSVLLLPSPLPCYPICCKKLKETPSGLFEYKEHSRISSGLFGGLDLDLGWNGFLLFTTR